MQKPFTNTATPRQAAVLFTLNLFVSVARRCSVLLPPQPSPGSFTAPPTSEKHALGTGSQARARLTACGEITAQSPGISPFILPPLHLLLHRRHHQPCGAAEGYLIRRAFANNSFCSVKLSGLWVFFCTGDWSGCKPLERERN